MHLKDFLREENVFAGLAASSKSQLIRLLAEKAGEKTSAPASLLSKALFEREALGSTGIGSGIAIPHAVVKDLETSICIIARLSKPIDFQAVDDIPVDIVVLLLTPAGAQSDALNVLSCIARRFRDDDLVGVLRAARTQDEFFALLLG
ncbi:PTS sugar transporter subunit IIA (plasmid) [Rhizobium sp. TRM96647]|uniref:PTS sugar transporter subunit IIA n=1 Tax=unclassified Rhizobium TaxID=2613769 RepID=UPI0021E95418|nr:MULTISPECIES: PTS sugar transporter subunit IIA [unclassified Rhizobium]MCV3735219.1 PTS sugar transporter subunit IIA [Rhizobium sp. TRM96647]MCV3758018.1 PTS sugar transporter subunit IIA [Rhizobium sp. TRM96650]